VRCAVSEDARARVRDKQKQTKHLTFTLTSSDLSVPLTLVLEKAHLRVETRMARSAKSFQLMLWSKEYWMSRFRKSLSMRLPLSSRRLGLSVFLEGPPLSLVGMTSESFMGRQRR